LGWVWLGVGRGAWRGRGGAGAWSGFAAGMMGVLRMWRGEFVWEEPSPARRAWGDWGVVVERGIGFAVWVTRG